MPEQYCYIEAQVEGDYTAEEAVGYYRDISKTVHGQEVGLPEMEWKGVFASYLRNISITPEIHELMSPLQRWEIHELDNMKARQSYKNPKGTPHHSLTDNKNT